MELNAQTLTLFFTVFIAAWQVGKTLLRVIAPMTQTKLDDKALNAMNQLENKISQIEESEWVKDYGPLLFEQVEAFAKGEGKGLKNVRKLAQYLGMAQEAYLKAKSAPLSASAIELLKQIAAGMAAKKKAEISIDTRAVEAPK